MPVTITREQPDSEAVMQLIAELEAHLSEFYPVESRHGYSVEKLLREGVVFFVIWQEGVPVGCGGVQLFGSEYGELKRMYVRPALRGLGLGKRNRSTFGQQVERPAFAVGGVEVLDAHRVEDGLARCPRARRVDRPDTRPTCRSVP